MDQGPTVLVDFDAIARREETQAGTSCSTGTPRSALPQTRSSSAQFQERLDCVELLIENPRTKRVESRAGLGLSVSVCRWLQMSCSRPPALIRDAAHRAS